MLLMPSGENFHPYPRGVLSYDLGNQFHVEMIVWYSVVFEGLLPTQVDRMSDGFHTLFDGSPLF